MTRAAWAATPEPQKQEMYAVHAAFAKLLAERGHQVTGGAELAPSSEAQVLRTTPEGEQTVTQGPYAETAEQLTGFYVIESDGPRRPDRRLQGARQGRGRDRDPRVPRW